MGRGWSAAALVGSLMLSGAACGTRVQESAAPEAATHLPAPVSASVDQPGATGGVAAPAAAAPTGGSSATQIPVVAGGRTTVTAPAPAASSPRPGPETARTPATGGGTAPAPGTGGSGGPLPPTTPTPGTVAPAAGSEVLMASVGTLSGPLGSVFLPMVNAVQVWVKHTNARGGVNGHPVKLITYDDGADPSRHRAAVQDAVERKHVLAFVQQMAGVTGKGSVEYITAKRIPVIGGDGASPWFNESPMYFQPTANASTLYATTVYNTADVAIPAGKAKVALLLCAEAQACTDVGTAWDKVAASAKLQIVYKANPSITQPDFTAECLAARNAGAQTVFISMDTNSLTRVVSSCKRQGYTPLFATLSGIATEALKGNPDLAGLTAPSPVFPWFQTGTPATDEYRQAMANYGRSIPQGVGPAAGWVTAKLVEKATAKLPEPPTSEAILQGLWSIKNDTLGGLTLPLTFTAEQPTPGVACWWSISLVNGAWATPDNFTRHCR